MFKLMCLLLMTSLSLGGMSFSPIEDNSPLTKDISYKASHSDGLKHDSVDSFLESEEVIFYKEINDFYGNSFDLYELSPSGYAIYAKNESSTAFLEGSHSSYSPFHDFLDRDLYYLGLGSYYYQEGTNVIDIETGNPLDNIEEITSYSYSLSEDIFLDNDESEIEPYKFVNIDDDTDLGSGSGSSSGSGSGSSSSGSGSSGDSTSSLTTTYKGFTCIKNYEYFKNLEYYPHNYDGACAIVAICIMIGYLDEYYDDGYIPESKEDDYKDHDGTSDKMKEEVMENYMEVMAFAQKCFGGYPMAKKQIENTISNYMSDLCSQDLINKTSLTNHKITNTHSKPREFIDDGNPTIITMLTYDNNFRDTKKPHTCVAYGYNKEDDTFLVHSGWHNGDSDGVSGSEVIISNATIYSYNLVEYVGA